MAKPSLIHNKRFIKQQKSKLSKEIIKHRYLYLFLLPAIIWYAVFNYAPIYGLIIAFKDYKIGLGIFNSPWVGLDHFIKMFSSYEFATVLKNTFIISGLKLIFVSSSGLVLALMFHEINSRRFISGIQSIVTIPHFLSWVIIAGIMKIILSPTTGIVNQLIEFFGAKPIYFLANKKWFVPTIVLSDVWQSAGWGSIIYSAALAGVDKQLYEAATLDGSNRWDSLIHITIPSIMNVVLVMLIMNVGHIMNAGFTQIFNLMNNAVTDVADIIDTYVYRQGLVKLNYSYSTAVGLFKNVVGLILVITTNTIANKYEQTGLW